MPNLLAQNYSSADPYYLLKNEKKQFSQYAQKPELDSIPKYFHTQVIRPFYTPIENKPFSIRLRNEQYYNENAPNQENMDIKYIGAGNGWYTGYNISFYSNFLAFTVEPYLLRNENKDFEPIERSRPFTHLNDVRIHDKEGYIDSGFREAMIYLHYKGFGVGYGSNNMWWGPGLHSSLTMSNNTIGFPHYSLGTLHDIRIKKWGINTKAILGYLNEETGNDAIYFSALYGIFSYYSNPVISLGLTRQFISGGVELDGYTWGPEKALELLYDDLFRQDIQGTKPYLTGSGVDPWDQFLIGYISMSFPASGLLLFLEYGTHDHRFSYGDLITEPDHATGSIIGFRKYGMFENPNLFFVFEYANLIRGRYHIHRGSANWYEKSHYDDLSYLGRRWAAHSGSDSDDFLLMFGLLNDRFVFLPGFNYERHGMINFRVPEVKMEFRLDARYKYKDVWFNLYYEYQHEQHLGFPKDNVYLDEATGLRFTNTIMLGIEKLIYF